MNLVCRDLNEGRIAIIGVGRNPTLSHLETIATVLNIPFLSVKWNDNYDNEPLVASTTDKKKNKKKNDEFEENYYVLDENYQNVYDNDELVNPFSLNVHSPSSKVMHAIVDLTENFKWEFITILYQESLGLEHIQDLIRLPTIAHLDRPLRTQVRKLSSIMNEWVYLLKDVKLSGSSHIIVDIETKYINDFIKQVSLK